MADHANIGKTDHIVARYYMDHFTNAGVLNTANLLTYSDQADIRVQNALVTDTHTFSTNLLSNLTANYFARDARCAGHSPELPTQHPSSA